MQNNRSAYAKKEETEDRRGTILRIAYRAFLQNGYAATSMSSIASKVGGSKATLYAYFSSKEDLFAAVVEEMCNDVVVLVSDAEVEVHDFSSALSHLAERFIRLILRDENIATHRLISAEANRFPELGRAFYRSGPKRSRALLASFFERAIREDKLISANTQQMAELFTDLCKGELRERKLWNVKPSPSEEDIKARVEQVVYVFLSAYGIERPETPK
ncbi:MAG: TetR/AcrR family transcriptional regulator [Proteobacteria bacterium]|jgi:AcrR family transcriptional regulator|nr:TetR/AcrR family transcriptional regulator [Pseudomonadota bacterium]